MICSSKHDRPEMESLGTNAACRPFMQGPDEGGLFVKSVLESK